MKAIIDLILALPEFLKLIKLIQKQSKERQMKEDVKKINKAFEDKDEKALRDIFNNNN